MAKFDVPNQSSDPNLVKITRPDGTKVEIANTPGNFGIIQAASQGRFGTVSPGSAMDESVNTDEEVPDEDKTPDVVTPDVTGNASAGVGAPPPTTITATDDSPDMSGASPQPEDPASTTVAPSQVGAPPVPRPDGNNNAVPPQNMSPMMASLTNPMRSNGARADAAVYDGQGGSGGDGDFVDQGRTPTAGGGGGGGQGGGGNGLLTYEQSDSNATHRMSKEARTADAEAMRMHTDALAKSEQLLHAQADAKIAEANYRTQILGEQGSEIRAHNQAVDHEVARRMQDIDATTQKLSQMSIDPSKAYGDGATPSKILAAIGIALGAMGSARTGAPNQAVNIVDQAIQRDIEVQKANIEKTRGVLEAQRGGLGDYMKVADHEQTAMNLEHARQLALADQYLAKVQAGIDNNQGAAAQIATMRADIAQRHAAFIQQATGSVQTTTRQSMIPGMMGKDLPPEQSKLITDNENKVNLYSELYKKIDQNPKLVGAFRAKTNDVARKFGEDDPQMTSLYGQYSTMLTKEAVDQGITRQSAIDEYVAGQMPKPSDSPETAKALIMSKIKQHATEAANARVQLGGMGHRLPNPPPGYQQNLDQINNYKRFGGKVAPSVARR